MLTAKAQLGLIWGGIKEVLLPLGCSQCGCSCPQSPGNLLILLLFLIWQFRRNRHQWLPTKQDRGQSRVLPFLFPTSPNFPERAQSWQPQRGKGDQFHKEEEEEDREEDEEEKEEYLLRQMRLDPQWYFHPRKMEAEQKASFFQKETLGTLNEDVGNLYLSILGPHGEYQPFVGSKEFPVKTVIPELMPNSHYLHSPTNLIQAPTSLCPLSTSSAKTKESIQLFWGLPSLHSESLGAIFPKSYCTFPTGATNEQLLSDTPIIFFNEFSYIPLPNLVVKTVSLPPPYLSLSSPLPVLHGNCEVAEMASPEFPDGSEIAWWASESQDPILDPQLPLLSPHHFPVKPQQVDFMEITKVITSDAYDVPGPQDVQQSKLPWSPKSPAQTLSPPSVLLPEPQGPVEDPKVIVSEVLLGDQWQTQFPQDPDPSAPALNASPPQLLIPQEASLMGAWNETAPMILHGPKASCYNTQQSELPWDVGTPSSCLSLPEPQGTDPTENPLMIPHVPEFPWYNMQEKEPPCPAAPLAPVLNMNLQSELQGASFIEVPKGLIPIWDRMQTPPPWTSGLSSFPQAEPQEANSEESPVPSASPVLPGWGVQQTHLPCTLRHNTPPPESPSQTWPTTLRVPAETREDEHHPPGSFTGAMLLMSKIVTSIPQEEGAMGEAPLHSQGILGPGTEGCPWIKEPRIQLKKAQCNPGSPSLAPSPPFPGLFFPRTSSQQDLCSLATPFYPTTCQIPAPNPTSQGAVGTLSSNYAHVQAKAMSPNAQPLHCHPPASPQLLVQELSRDGQGPAREGKEVPLMPPQTPDLQATKVPEPQSLSQYKARAATKRPRAPRRAIREGSEKSDPPAPDKSQAQASVPSRKREHSRKPKAGDQGGGDARWGASLSKGKSHSSEAKKLTSHLPARKSLVSPHQASRNLCQTTSHLDLLQPSPKAETSQVLPSQSSSKGQSGGDSSDSRHQQNHSQGRKFPRREARKGSSSSSSGPAKRGLKKFLEGLLNSLSHSQRDQSMECLQAAMKIAQGSRSGQALRLTPQ